MNIEQINKKLEEIKTNAGTIKMNRNLSFLCLSMFTLDSSMRLKKLMVESTWENAFSLGIESLFIIISIYEGLTNQSDLIKLQKESQNLIKNKNGIRIWKLFNAILCATGSGAPVKLLAADIPEIDIYTPTLS